MSETCPVCDGPMESGSVYSVRWIRWLPAGQSPPVFLGQLKHEELVGMGWRTPKPVPARRCVTCRRVEFTY